MLDFVGSHLRRATSNGGYDAVFFLVTVNAREIETARVPGVVRKTERGKERKEMRKKTKKLVSSGLAAVVFGLVAPGANASDTKASVSDLGVVPSDDSEQSAASELGEEVYSGSVCHEWDVGISYGVGERVINWRRPRQDRLEIGHIISKKNPVTGRMTTEYQVTTWYSYAIKFNRTIAKFEADRVVELEMSSFDDSNESVNQFLYEVQMVRSYLQDPQLCAPPIPGGSVSISWCSLSCGILGVSFGAAVGGSFTAMCAGGSAGFGAPACLGFADVLLGTSVLFVREVCEEVMSCDERDAKGSDPRPNHSGG